MAIYLLLLFVLCQIVFAVCYVMNNQKHLQGMNGMIVTMGMSMMAGASVGTIIGVLFVHDIFSSTIISVLIGLFIGFIIGWPINLFVSIEGMLSGLMGGMMGAMVGNMVGRPGEMIKIILLLSIMIYSFIVSLIQQETKNYQSKFSIILMIMFVLIFLFLSVNELNLQVDLLHKEYHHFFRGNVH
ncbi:hypothetical protein ACFSCX_02920 [Bacillus salitolerans]|uniref:Uncharacterized protein n=1 Tax=Bacillus salitolerans TaxID=1437434 RepID=A0ABW4LLX4_9BACI